MATEQLHELKVWPEFFRAIWTGEKTFECRENDRNFLSGDTVILKEWEGGKGYTGRWMRSKIGFVFNGGSFGVHTGYVVFSLLYTVRFWK